MMRAVGANPGLTNDDYTVGWMCALKEELAASRAMLDEEHPRLSQVEHDNNSYTLGRIGQHNVVLACLPSGSLGAVPTATAATNMLRSFPRIRFGLMVGIGGGVPGPPNDDPEEDIRLGDVVVSHPTGIYGGRYPSCIYPINSSTSQAASCSTTSAS
jgi:nucleoside phosphorylase